MNTAIAIRLSVAALLLQFDPPVQMMMDTGIDRGWNQRVHCVRRAHQDGRAEQKKLAYSLRHTQKTSPRFYAHRRGASIGPLLSVAAL